MANLKCHFFIAISVILLSAALVASILLTKKIDTRKQHQIDLVEFQHVRYGILNPHEWKRKVSTIISHRLDNIDFDQLNKKEIKAQIIKALNRLFTEVEKMLNQKKAEGNWLERTLRTTIMEFTLDLDSFKLKIPELADSIMKELDTPEARENLKEFIQKKINTMVDKSVGEEDTNTLDILRIDYQCDDNQSCQTVIQTTISAEDKDIFWLSMLEILSIVTLFIMWYALRDKECLNVQWYFLFIGLLILLYSGLTSPMINIDARIDQIKISLLNSDIQFTDQVLFFQSKSIMDVVIILIKNGDFQTMLVGVLILLFSIVFPFLKMMSLLSINIRKQWNDNSVLNFLAYKTSKWSMADVFVVAIFMAYIGFRGVLNSQLSHLQSATQKADIIATDHSSLQVGIMFFTCFVLLGILFSQISQYKNTKKYNLERSDKLIA